jgi:hypothetical protein
MPGFPVQSHPNHDADCCATDETDDETDEALNQFWQNDSAGQ